MRTKRIFKRYFFLAYFFYSSLGGAKMMNTISFKDNLSWRLIGTSNCPGKVFLNDFYWGDFKSTDNSSINLPVFGSHLKKGSQSIQIVFDEVCFKNTKVKPMLFEARLAGFKQGEWPALNAADSKIQNAFGQFPTMGLVVLSFTSKDITTKGEISKSGGEWDGPSAIDSLEIISLDEKTQTELRAFIKDVHKAISTSNYDFMHTIKEFKIRRGVEFLTQDAKEADSLFQQKVANMKAEFDAIKKNPKILTQPLPVKPLNFRLVANKVVEITDSQGTPFSIEQNEGPNSGSIKTSLLIARIKGRWILY